jgi:predicted DNA-binding protein with PD1-like motif
MEYSTGRPGRIFFSRFEHGEDLLSGIRTLCLKEAICFGTVQVIGALLKGTMVCGPREPVLPPVQVSRPFSAGWEVIGFGVILPGVDGPRVHLHASLGRGGEVMTGCLRAAPATYITIEAIITEVEGIKGNLVPESRSGQVLPHYDCRLDTDSHS